MFREGLARLPGSAWEGDRSEFCLLLGNLSLAYWEAGDLHEARVTAELLLACGGASLKKDKRNKLQERSRRCTEALPTTLLKVV